MEKAIDQFVGITAQFKKALVIANEIPVTPADARSLFAGWAGSDTNGNVLADFQQRHSTL